MARRRAAERRHDGGGCQDYQLSHEVLVVLEVPKVLEVLVLEVPKVLEVLEVLVLEVPKVLVLEVLN
jgi:hypothetical protein